MPGEERPGTVVERQAVGRQGCERRLEGGRIPRRKVGEGLDARRERFSLADQASLAGGGE